MICDGILASGNPCKYKAHPGHTRCARHQDKFFCGVDLGDGRSCGARVQSEGQRCKKHLEVPLEPLSEPIGTPEELQEQVRSLQALLMRHMQAHEHSKQKLREALADAKRSKEAESRAKQELHRERVLMISVAAQTKKLENALNKILRGLDLSQKAGDQVPVRVRLGDELFYVQTCPDPEKYADQTGYGYRRSIPEPNPGSEVIQCAICMDSAPSTGLISCHGKMEDGSGICQACTAELLESACNPSCPICRKPIPLGV